MLLKLLKILLEILYIPISVLFMIIGAVVGFIIPGIIYEHFHEQSMLKQYFKRIMNGLLYAILASIFWPFIIIHCYNYYNTHINHLVR